MKRLNNRIQNRLVAIKERFTLSSLKQRFKPRRLVLSIVFPAALLVLYLISPIKIGAALDTHSVDCLSFLYQERPFTRPPAAGDYVLFLFKKEDLSPEYWEVFKDMKLIKRVGCAGGSYLECSFGKCTCDGKTVVKGLAEKFSSRAWNYSGVVPPGKVFLVGEDDASYDGRYWGCCPRLISSVW